MEEIFLRPTAAARATLPEDRLAGWWDDFALIPRNRKNQRITVDGRSYRILQTLDVQREYLNNTFRDGIIWDVDVDRDPSKPAYPRDFDAPQWTRRAP